MGCLVIFRDLIDIRQRLSLNEGELSANYVDKKPFTERLGSWWGSSANDNLRNIVNEVAKFCLSLSIASDAKSLAYYGLTNLKMLQEKVVKHNKRWDVRLLSLFFKCVKCPDLKESIAAVEDLLQQKRQIANVLGLIDYLDKKPLLLAQAGIFRACGDDLKIKAFQKIIKGPYWSGIPVNTDPAVITGLLKEGLRDIPSVNKDMKALLKLSSNFYSMDAAKIPGYLKEALEGRDQREFLGALFSLLHKVSGIGARDLATEIAPYLCGEEANQGVELIVYLIEHYDEIF